MENELKNRSVSFNILDEESNISLRKVTYRGYIVGKFNTWSVEQEYLNQNKEGSVEIYYTFPLKAGATVTSFEALIGDKTLKGIVKEKKEANKAYQKAIAKGDSAYLMERLDSNMFKISLGRVMPDELIKITISFIETCDVYDHQIDILVPTLVAQRYGDSISNNLLREDRTSYTCDFFVNIEENLSVKDVDSSTHSIKVMNNRKITSLNNTMNRDFKLEIKLNNDFKTTALRNGQYVLIDLMTQLEEPKERTPKKYIFLIDRSGSMQGRNINAVKDLLKAVLTHLESNDLIEIISFGSYHVSLFNSLRAVQDVRSELRLYMSALDASMGGTEILSAIEKSLSYAHDANIILITDGQVANEDYIANSLSHKIKNNHLFVLGLDMNVNASAINKIAKAGHGKAYYFTPNDNNYSDKLIRAFKNISRTISSNVNITSNNKELDRYLYSNTLFNHEYWTAILKLEDLTEDISIIVDNTQIVIKKESVKTSDIELNKILASCKINYYESLINRELDDSKGYQDLIIDLAIENQIDSKYTSYLAINERENKIYDVPQIELTPIENSFDMIQSSAMHYFAFDRLDLKKSVVYEDISAPMNYLEKSLAKLIKLISLSKLSDSSSHILTINKMIKALDNNAIVKEEVKLLMSKIKMIDESLYHQLFNGVESSVQALFN